MLSGTGGIGHILALGKTLLYPRIYREHEHGVQGALVQDPLSPSIEDGVIREAFWFAYSRMGQQSLDILDISVCFRICQ
jgi:hypothetical protein